MSSTHTVILLFVSEPTTGIVPPITPVDELIVGFTIKPEPCPDPPLPADVPNENESVVPSGSVAAKGKLVVAGVFA